MGVGFVFSAVFFIAWPSQCPSGRRGPGEFVEDGSPVADPFGWVPAVLPALAHSQEEDLRLHEARTCLLADPGDIAGTGHAVGYASPSQFSREYRRMFGAPPSRHAPALRAVAG
jgi:AraC-like DNA-binding protein